MPNAIPRGPEDMDCPFHKKPMSKVCHTCPLWTHLVGKNPQGTGEYDEWNCALGQLPILLVENSQRQRQTGAAVNEMTSETKLTREELRKGREENHDAMMGTLLTIVNRVAVPQTLSSLPGGIQNGGAGPRMLPRQGTES